LRAPRWAGGVNAPRDLRISSEKHTGTGEFPAVCPVRLIPTESG